MSKQIATEIQELRDIIHRHYESSGMRSTHTEIMHDVVVPTHIVAYLVRRGMSGQITSYFNSRRKDGLPFAPFVNDRQEHVPLDLADLSELEYVATAAVRRGDAEYAQARKVATLARERFGRSIIVDGVDLSEEVRAA